MISVSDGLAPLDGEVSVAALSRYLKRATGKVGLEGAVDVLLTSDVEIRRLNRQFRRKNKATDVLSFPAEPMPGLPAGEQRAGDLAISVDTARKQAEEHGHSTDVELRVLLLHGLLHLAGLDHETDTGEMRAREQQLRRELRLPGSLIERTLGSLELPEPAATLPRSTGRVKKQVAAKPRTGTAAAKAAPARKRRA